MARIENIIVNNKTYKVQTLGVLDSLYFQAKVVHALGSSVGELFELYYKAKTLGDIDAGELGASLSKINPDALKSIQPEILKQTITPENKFLEDQQYLEEWFSRPENTGDVWEVMYKGALVLLGEYRPNFLRGNLQTKTEAPAQ